MHPPDTAPSSLKTRKVHVRHVVANIFGMRGTSAGYDSILALHAGRTAWIEHWIDARYQLQHAIAAIQRAAERRDAKILVLPNGQLA